MCSNDNPVQPKINKTGAFFFECHYQETSLPSYTFLIFIMLQTCMWCWLVFLSQFIAFETTSEAEMDLLFLHVSDNVKGTFS